MKRALRTLGVVFAGIALSNGRSAIAGLTLAQRVACQQAIEEVYWRHRIWPSGNGPKPPLAQVVTEVALREKVDDSLRKSQALAEYWQRPLGAKQLQAEMNRMARQTRDAGRLREVWAGLGNDPYLIAECLARPALADRLIHNWYAEPNGKDFGAWWASARRTLRGEVVDDPQAEYRLPAISAGESGCVTDTWRDTSANYPEGRQDHAALWTGTEMIVWGGISSSGAMAGHRYDPATDTWSVIREDGAPSRRAYHSAVWTGTEMIVWGGYSPVTGQTDSGGRYNPMTDTWTLTSRIEVPSPRIRHTAIWTGTQMVIWGGSDNTGGLYDPATDRWMPTSLDGAPRGRESHTAVWTGTEMIVWGGRYAADIFDSGGRYNPKSDTWTSTNLEGAPSGRTYHSAVWTGTEMIVWSGARVYRDPEFLDSGGRYDPVTDRWTRTSQEGAPSARWGHTAIWTGTEMIVWGGGQQGYFAIGGGRYDPATDTWRAPSVVDAPRGRGWHTAVWTGREMIVWSGIEGNLSFAERLGSGGRYDPANDTWVATAESGTPRGRNGHSAVWTGAEMIVWGGRQMWSTADTGGRYDPATDIWTATRQDGAPIGREGHAVVWTGTEMIVWGGRGYRGETIGTGGRYNPASDTWVATPGLGAPSAREGHTAVWTGAEMIVWGGRTGHYADDTLGYRYNPATDTWALTTRKGTPEPRYGHTAVWTGNEMIVWGGHGDIELLVSGGRYDPTTDSWSATVESGAGAVRTEHTAVWTGVEMIVWGGFTGTVGYLTPVNTGSRYDPTANRWTATSQDEAPSIRSGYTVVWTGNEMIVWGGQSDPYTVDTGHRYDPATDSWAATTQLSAPRPRANHSAVWTGDEMIVWGGSGFPYLLDTGGRYCPRSGANP